MRALRRRRPYVIKRRAEDISNQTVNNTIDDDRVARQALLPHTDSVQVHVDVSGASPEDGVERAQVTERLRVDARRL